MSCRWANWQCRIFAFLQRRKTQKSKEQHHERRVGDDGVTSDHHRRSPVHQRRRQLVVVGVTLGIAVDVVVDGDATKKNELRQKDVANRHGKRMKFVGRSSSP